MLHSVQPSQHKPALVPAHMLERIVETLHPEQVWLFGSRARGDHRRDSDWDILAVLPDTARDDEVDLVETWRRLRDLRLLRVEVFPVRRADFEREQQALGTLCQIARSEGQLVYAA
jgi:predicted nucleotidyltransferase